MKASYSPDDRLELPWMVSYSYFDRSLFSEIKKKITFFKSFGMFFWELLSFCFGLRLLSFKLFFVFRIRYKVWFHPRTRFKLFECNPFLQENILYHFFQIGTKFEIFMLGADSFLEKLPKFWDMFFVNISIKWIKFLVFFKERHITG